MAFNPVLRSCEEKDQIGLAGVWSFLQPAATASEVPDKVIYIRFDIFLQIDKLQAFLDFLAFNFLDFQFNTVDNSIPQYVGQ